MVWLPLVSRIFSKWSASKRTQKRLRRTSPERSRSRPSVEHLETRITPSTLISGTITLPPSSPSPVVIANYAVDSAILPGVFPSQAELLIIAADNVAQGNAWSVGLQGSANQAATAVATNGTQNATAAITNPVAFAQSAITSATDFAPAITSDPTSYTASQTTTLVSAIVQGQQQVIAAADAAAQSATTSVVGKVGQITTTYTSVVAETDPSAALAAWQTGLTNVPNNPPAQAVASVQIGPNQPAFPGSNATTSPDILLPRLDGGCFNEFYALCQAFGRERLNRGLDAIGGILLIGSFGTALPLTGSRLVYPLVTGMIGGGAMAAASLPSNPDSLVVAAQSFAACASEHGYLSGTIYFTNVGGNQIGKVTWSTNPDGTGGPVTVKTWGWNYYLPWNNW